MLLTFIPRQLYNTVKFSVLDSEIKMMTALRFVPCYVVFCGTLLVQQNKVCCKCFHAITIRMILILISTGISEIWIKSQSA